MKDSRKEIKKKLQYIRKKNSKGREKRERNSI